MLANPSSAPALAKPSDTSPTHSTPASPTVPEAVRLLEPTVRNVIAQMKHLQTHNDPKPVLPTKIVSGDKVIFTKTTQNNIGQQQQNQTNQKECNDFSESTSTLTINPDAAFSQELLATAINYEVS